VKPTFWEIVTELWILTGHIAHDHAGDAFVVDLKIALLIDDNEWVESPIPVAGPLAELLLSDHRSTRVETDYAEKFREAK